MSDDRNDAPVESGSEGGLNVRLVLLALVAIVLAVFVFQNTASTEVKFLGFQSEPPLWVSLVLAAVGGALVSQLAGWAYRRRRR